jgi:hypothetical protein
VAEEPYLKHVSKMSLMVARIVHSALPEFDRRIHDAHATQMGQYEVAILETDSEYLLGFSVPRRWDLRGVPRKPRESPSIWTRQP